MYGLEGGAVKLILLLVSDIDDNFWFLTAVQVTGLKNLLSLTEHHLLPHHTTKSPSDPDTTLPLQGRCKLLEVLGGPALSMIQLRRSWLGSRN